MKQCEFLLKVAQIELLPSPPLLIERLIKNSVSEDINLKELEDIILSDPAITAQVLKVANSAYFGFSGQVATIKKAILLLGACEVWNIAFSAALHQQFSQLSISPYFNIIDFWHHSFTTGIVSEHISNLLGNSSQRQDSITIGLLHDIGKLIMATYFQEEFDKVIRLSSSSGISIIEAETEIGLLHTEVGKWLVRRWKLPQTIEEAVVHHHILVSECKPPQNGIIVCIANMLSKEFLQKGVDAMSLNIQDSPIQEKEYNMLLSICPWAEDILNRAREKAAHLVDKAKGMLSFLHGE